MPKPADDGGSEGLAPSASHLRAAQLRARAIRGGIVRIALGTLFLVGALAHALSPQRHEISSRLWMTGLLLSSTLNVGWGLRAISSAQASGARLPASHRSWRGTWRGTWRSTWMYATGAWAVLGLALLGLLLRR